MISIFFRSKNCSFNYLYLVFNYFCQNVDFEGEGTHADDSDSDEDSDIVSYQDDMDSSEEEPEKVKTSQGLEWDDSTF